jgi:hypothetical protein
VSGTGLVPQITSLSALDRKTTYFNSPLTSQFTTNQLDATEYFCR